MTKSKKISRKISVGLEKNRSVGPGRNKNVRQGRKGSVEYMKRRNASQGKHKSNEYERSDSELLSTRSNRSAYGTRKRWHSELSLRASF